MSFSFEPSLLVGFCLVLVRATAWVSISPPFNTPAIPVRVRVGFAVALAFLLARVVGPEVQDLSTPALVGALFTQIIGGLALGAFVFVVFSGVQAAGDLIDLQVGFSLGGVIDPLSGNMAAPMGRLYQLMGLAFLFAINGHISIVSAFVQSVEVAPLGKVDIAAVASGLTEMVVVMFSSAIQIALPILTALFCTEVALGLLGKAAPQLNILVIGFAVKALIAFMLLGATLVLLPGSVDSLIGRGLSEAAEVFRG